MTGEHNEFDKEIHIIEDDSASEPESNLNDRGYDDYIFTKYSGKHRRFGPSSNHNTTTYSSKNNFVREAHSESKRHRRKRRPLWKKLLIIAGWILVALLILAIVAVGVFFILKQVGISQLRNDDVDMTAPIIENAGVSVNNSDNTITYNGVTYVYNSNMTSILCMGVDKEEMGLESDIVGTGGQADALYLIALDTATGETDVIGISRDIYSDISVYSADGQYVGTENAQLCLAYAYGDGKEKSAQNTTDAVSRLFYNLPINSYFAVDLNAIADLNDAVGGITVTLTDDYLYHSHGMGRAGETVRLYGEQAKWFLRYRNVEELNSSADRMDRQLQYLQKFGATAVAMTKQDLSTPVTLFGIVQDYSVTNLNASKIAALGYTVATSGAELEFHKVPGEVIHNGEYAQYVVDEQGLLEIILDVYYTPIS